MRRTNPREEGRTGWRENVRCPPAVQGLEKQAARPLGLFI